MQDFYVIRSLFILIVFKATNILFSFFISILKTGVVILCYKSETIMGRDEARKKSRWGQVYKMAKVSTN
jgi:hypothetical protein